MSFSLRTPPFSLPLPSYTHSRKSQTDHFSCFSQKPNKGKSSELGASASELAAEAVQRIKTQLEERENAMKNSKQLLFSDLCKYLNLEAMEVKNKWGQMNPDEKLGLIQGFVSDWGLRFHPLSARSVRDMVEEFVIEDVTLERESLDYDDSSSISAVIFPRLKKLIMGLSQDD